MTHRVPKIKAMNTQENSARDSVESTDLLAVFVIYDDNNSSFAVKGVFDSYKKAFDALPDHGHAIMEFKLNELDNGFHC